MRRIARTQLALALGPDFWRRVAWTQFALAVGLVLLGTFIIVEAQSVKVAPVYSRVGPRIIPTIVGAATVLIALALGFVAARGGWKTGHEEGEARDIDWAGLGLISAGLIVQIVLIQRAGFVLSSTLLFFLVAAGFRSRAWLRNAAVGLVLSTVTYVGFTRGLGLALPPGVLEGIL